MLSTDVHRDTLVQLAGYLSLSLDLNFHRELLLLPFE